MRLGFLAYPIAANMKPIGNIIKKTEKYAILKNWIGWDI